MKAFNDVYETSDIYKVNMRTVSYILAIRRGAEAIEAQGGCSHNLWLDMTFTSLLVPFLFLFL